MFPYVNWIDGCHIAREVSVKLQNEFKFIFREVHGLKKTYLLAPQGALGGVMF